MRLKNRRSNYIASLYPLELKLKQVWKQAEKLRPGMQIGEAEVAILNFLIAHSSPKKILEVGCFVGFSAINISRAAGGGAQIFTIEKDDNYADLAAQNFADCGCENIEILRGSALQVLADLKSKGESFDMIFLDAQKSEYVQYLDYADALLAEGGMVIADNTFLFNEVFEEYSPELKSGAAAHKAMGEFNKIFAEKFTSCLIPTDEGLSVGIKKI